MVRKLIQAPDLRKEKSQINKLPVDNKELVAALKLIIQQAQDTDEEKKKLIAELLALQKDIAKLTNAIKDINTAETTNTMSLSEQQKQLTDRLSQLTSTVEQDKSRVDMVQEKVNISVFETDLEPINKLLAQVKDDIKWLTGEIDRLNDMMEKRPQTTYMVNEGMTQAQKDKLDGIETGAEVNNISDVNAADLTDGGESALHSHAGGSGDMTKAVYDSNEDGVIEKEQLDTELETSVGAQGKVDIHAADTSTHGVTTVDGVTERDAAITTHAGEADPHTVYPLDSEVLKKDGSVALTADWLIGEQAIQLDSALSADGKWSGDTFPGTAGATLVFGDVVYLASSGKWLLAKGDAEATISPMVALVIVGGADTESIVLMTRGFIREDDWNWATIGAPVFISAATAGDMSLTELTTGQFQKVVGHVWSADEIAVNVSPDWVKVG